MKLIIKVGELGPEGSEVKLPILRKWIELKLGCTLEEYIKDLFLAVFKDVGFDPEKVQYIYMRIFPAFEPKTAFAFKSNRLDMPHSFPDMTIGYTGDIEDFDGNLAHEILHVIKWDEKVVEARAQEILKRRR